MNAFAKSNQIENLIGKGKNKITFDQVPLLKASDYSCKYADIIWQLTEKFKVMLTSMDIVKKI